MLNNRILEIGLLLVQLSLLAVFVTGCCVIIIQDFLLKKLLKVILFFIYLVRSSLNCIKSGEFKRIDDLIKLRRKSGIVKCLVVLRFDNLLNVFLALVKLIENFFIRKHDFGVGIFPIKVVINVYLCHVQEVISISDVRASSVNYQEESDEDVLLPGSN